MMSSPEPMSLGSPHQSPSSAQYLPQFLLGEAGSTQSSIRPSQSSAGAKYWMTGGSSSPPRGGAASSLGVLQQALPSSSLNRVYSLNVYEASKMNSTGFVEKTEPSYGYMHQSSNHSGVFSPLNAYAASMTAGSNAASTGVGVSGGPIGSSNSLTGMQAPLTSSSSVGSSLADTRQQMPGAPPINRLADLLNKPSGTYLNPQTTGAQEPYGFNETKTKGTFIEHYNPERPTHELSGSQELRVFFAYLS
jgi:hypothetical protein